MLKILDEICDTIHNFFVVRGGVHRGNFNIVDGQLQCDFLKENQYFRVVGSVFNDGVWKYSGSEMTDEEFNGEVWEMAVPMALISLLSEIETWNEKYGSIDSGNMSPYQSESFNNYSYSKASVTRGDGSSGTLPMTWKDVFADRLNRWRKLG